MANIRVWTRTQRRVAELREMERLCSDWADDNDLVLARDGLKALAADYRAAADAMVPSGAVWDL
ncbi:hypothetical protein ABIC08_004412 [Bradyrhizobium sp. RT9b]